MAKTSRRMAGKETLSLGNYPTKPTVNDQELRNRIAEKAYELYEKRGRVEDHDVEHWLEAERLILAEIYPELREKLPTPRSGRHRAKKG